MSTFCAPSVTEDSLACLKVSLPHPVNSVCLQVLVFQDHEVLPMNGSHFLSFATLDRIFGLVEMCEHDNAEHREHSEHGHISVINRNDLFEVVCENNGLEKDLRFKLSASSISALQLCAYRMRSNMVPIEFTYTATDYDEKVQDVPIDKYTIIGSPII